MNTAVPFPKGQKATENFTGDAWVHMLTTDVENFDAMSYNVTFAPGSRNFWHSHQGGQIHIAHRAKVIIKKKANVHNC